MRTRSNQRCSFHLCIFRTKDIPDSVLTHLVLAELILWELFLAAELRRGQEAFCKDAELLWNSDPLVINKKLILHVHKGKANKDHKKKDISMTPWSNWKDNDCLQNWGEQHKAKHLKNQRVSSKSASGWPLGESWKHRDSNNRTLASSSKNINDRNRPMGESRCFSLREST
jgi:hypothetical protein